MDFRLKVFKKVSELKSFTKAATSLNISQPAVSKHISELEKRFGRALFERGGNKIILTTEGEYLLKYANKILLQYTDIEDYFLSLSSEILKKVTIGASTTIAQYVIPKMLPKMISLYPESTFTLLSGNTLEIEKWISNKEINFGLIEGKNNKPSLQYDAFVKDKIVLATNSNNTIRGSINLAKLQKLPIVLRESGSGTRDILEEELHKKGITLKNLNVETVLGSSESIKTYLSHSQSYAFLSINCIKEELKYGKFKIVDINGLDINRSFYFVYPQGFHSNTYDVIRKFLVKNI